MARVDAQYQLFAAEPALCDQLMSTHGLLNSFMTMFNVSNDHRENVLRALGFAVPQQPVRQINNFFNAK